MKKYLIILLCIFLGGSCQRDDICPDATQTTPNLVISFRDIENPALNKAVTNFNVREESKPDFYFDEPVTDTVAVIPLRNDQNFTNYYFTINSELSANGASNPERNRDQIQFSYATDEIYVSRACNYKTEFYQLEANLISNDPNADWIEILLLKKPI
ncbi:DUF6452 family protein [Mesonia maritima]|uniref:DUF6452 family protein n=1 Tax=Mesonia maritima TaxID=1793873 RepID=UPI00363119E5